ncbi:MAG: DUF4339 domain-containing protein [Planctomycetota bacterium]
MDRPPPPPQAPFSPAGDATAGNPEPHPDVVEWRLAVGDQQYGPTVTTVFAQWIAAGRVPRHGLVWRTGWPDWRRADEAGAELPAPLPTPRSRENELSEGRGSAALAYHRRRESVAQRRRWLAIGLAAACVALAAGLVVAIVNGPATDVSHIEPFAPAETPP